MFKGELINQVINLVSKTSGTLKVWGSIPQLSEKFRRIMNKIIFAIVCSLFSIVAQSQASYRYNGQAVLNDLTVTPGDVNPTDTKEVLCSPTFRTGTVRLVQESTKYKVCAFYGITKDKCVGATYEIDHLISLELGGSNDVKNLWPEPYLPVPGAKAKDTVENWLHKQVCSNNITLEEAQHEISTDWYKVYLTIPKENGGGK